MLVRTFWTVFITLIVAAFIAVAGLLGYSKFGHEPSGYVDEIHASQILGGDHRIHVRLPWYYDDDPEQSYPLIIKLDGTARLDWHDRNLAVMSELGLGDAIVVAIPNEGHRNRNLTPSGWPQDTDQAEPLGEGDRFLDYIEREIIPDIEARYRTNGQRILVGYSRGGLLAMHAMISRPELFDGHILLSPALWREDDRIISEAELYLSGHPAHASFLHMSLGSAENEKMTRAYNAMISVLETTAPADLEWRANFTRLGTHQTTPVVALPLAYEAMFESLAEPATP
jgi:predicted alpha/beta superfamily hydrolase